MERAKPSKPPSKPKPRRARANETLLAVVGKNVRLLRAMHGWTQEELAEKASLERNQVGELERGTRGVQLATLERLALALEVEAWELLRPRDEAGR